MHGVTGNQVQAREVGDQLQDRANLDVLEVQRKLFTAVGEALLAALLDLALGQRLDAHGQAIVGLEHQVIVIAGGFDIDQRTPAFGTRADEIDRGGEVLHVQANPQGLGQLRIAEVQANTPALFLDVRADRRIGEVDDHIALALLAALEIDVADGMARHAGFPGARLRISAGGPRREADSRRTDRARYGRLDRHGCGGRRRCRHHG